MAVQERVPAQVLRRSEQSGDYQPHLELTAVRFSGVLKHPVPRSEMCQKFGIDRRGCRVETRWPSRSADDQPVRPGDHLEVGGNTYEILGVQATPGICLQLYIDDI